MAADRGPVYHGLTYGDEFFVWLGNSEIVSPWLENGIRILADRDAIRVPGLPTMYYSTERLAQIEAFPNTEHVFCPRCKLIISEGDSAVCCPQCGVWHHERVPEDKNCWSYAETCALCDQSTDLDSASFRWTPDRL